MAVANAQPMVLVLHRELVTKTEDGVKPIPPKAERLQCKCGCTKFYVTKVDFVCSECSTSYRD